MADDALIDFTEQENDENICPYEDQETRARPPKLVQSPVIKNPILKQSNKDNLIQLYTPVQKPVKGKLKVTFGADSMLETPVSKKADKRPVKLTDVTENKISESKGHIQELSCDKEKEEWEERTSILTSIDHHDYMRFASEFVEEIIQKIPIKEEGDSSVHSVDSGLEGSAMDCSEYEAPAQMSAVADRDMSMDALSVLSRAEEMIKALQEKTFDNFIKSDEGFHGQEGKGKSPESDEEFMDCEEYMEVTDDSNPPITTTTDDSNFPITTTNDVQTQEVVKEVPESTDANVALSEKTDIGAESAKVSTNSNRSTTCNVNQELAGDERAIPQENRRIESEDGHRPEEPNLDEANSERSAISVESTPAQRSESNGKQASNPSQDDIEEQPILPKKGVYDLDALQSTEEQPILPKTGVYNLEGFDEVEAPVSHKGESCSQDESNQGEEVQILKEKEVDNQEELNNAEQNTLPSNPSQDNIEEQPILAKNGVYNLENLDNAEEQPILPKKGVYNLENLDNAEEQPILPKKGVYNLDNLDNAEEQPILPKKGVYNLDNLDNAEEQPILPKKGVYNLDNLDNAEEQPILPKKGEYNLDELEIKQEQSASAKKEDIEQDKHGNTVEQPMLSKSEVINKEKVGKTDNQPDLPYEVMGGNKNQLENTEEQPILPKSGVYNLESMEEQPILPKKGIYNLDDLDLESMDPFKTKAQVVNTPDKCSKTNTTSVAPSDAGNSNFGNKEPESATLQADNMEGSGETLHVDNDTNNKSDVQNGDNLKEIKDIQPDSIEDPFTARNQMQNSPLAKKNEPMEVNLHEIEDPFKPKTQMQNSPIAKQNTKADVNLDEIEDPFKPKTQMQNSPIAKQNTKADVDLNEIDDPFKPKTQMQNSPIAKQNTKADVNLDEINDPFKPKTQMQNSPIVKQNTKADVNLDEIDDPFKPKTQMQNSPIAKQNTKADVNLDEIEDPFKPKTQMQNSPIAKQNTKADVNLDEIDDPFKPKTQMQNSPIAKQNTKAEANLDEIEDPFKPKTQMQNSPIAKQNTKADVNLDEIDDPFKAKTQMQNSPIAKQNTKADVFLDEIEDPFKPKTQMQNSPIAKQNTKTDVFLDEIDDPFKPKTQMQNSPIVKQNTKADVFLDEIEDPFKPKTQMQNSPASKLRDSDKDLEENENKIEVLADKTTTDDEIKTPNSGFEFLDNIEDPFKPQTQMKNSPVSKPKTEDKAVTDGTMPGVEVFTTDAFDDIDPFKSKRQIPQSPSVNTTDKTTRGDVGEGANKEKEEAGSTGAKLTMSTVIIDQQGQADDGEEDDFIEITSITRRGEQPKDAVIGDFDAMDIDESQFVSAAHVFNDPGMLDLLENFGNSGSNQQESSLSRMSLYVKFDPLVEANQSETTNRRISIRPSQLEKLREFGLDDTLLLFGTPPKKKRKAMGSSSLKNTPTTELPLNKGKVPLAVAMETGAVDMLLACSPRKLKVTPTRAKISDTPSLLGEGAEGEALFEELKYTETDLRQVRENCKLEMQGLLLDKERQWYGKEQAHQQEKEALKLAINELKKKLKGSESTIAEFKETCDNYKETLDEIIVKMQKKDEEIKKVETQRDTAFNDIKSVDNAFSELHTRYDKLRSIVDAMKKNEEALKKYISECHDKLKEKEANHTSMKKSYEEKCKRLTQDNERLQQESTDIQTKSEVQAKLSSRKIESLEQQIEQKIKEIKELTEICDDLIARRS